MFYNCFAVGRRPGSGAPVWRVWLVINLENTNGDQKGPAVVRHAIEHSNNVK